MGLGWILDEIWMDIGSILDGFWITLDGFWIIRDRSWIDLGSVWIVLGASKRMTILVMQLIAVSKWIVRKTSG